MTPMIVEHPLLQHKISILRNKQTGTKEFRDLVGEIATLLCYEATRDLPLEEVEIETPITMAKTKVLAGRKLALVPILRAGMGMLDGMLTLLPAAKVGFIGLYRDEETLQPVEYFCKLPKDFHEREQLRQPRVEHAHERKTDPIDHHAAHAVRARRIAGIRELLPQRVLRDDVRIIRDRHAAAPVVRLCGDDAARVQQRIRDGVLARPADYAGHIQLQNRGRHGRSLFVSFPRSAHSSTPPDAPHASTAAAAGPITPHAASGRHTA